jgi:hypothetical protein
MYCIFQILSLKYKEYFFIHYHIIFVLFITTCIACNDILISGSYADYKNF